MQESFTSIRDIIMYGERNINIDQFYEYNYKLRRKEDFIMEKTILSSFKLTRLRQMLHAHELSFAHPKSGQRIFLRGELPPDFLNLLSNLEKYKTS